jgi:glucose-1-phosphate cytidylyltransferase
MKVIILAGGFGTRLSEYTETIPKPMVDIGGKPILWHIMKTFAKYGHKDFYLALGYKAELIKEYFLHYSSLNSDFTVDLSNGDICSHQRNRIDWKVTLVDTGLSSMTGGRVKRMKSFIGNEPFLLTYGDGVANIDIEALIKFHKEHGKMVTVTAVHPGARFGELDIKGKRVDSFKEKPQVTQGWINGGYFVIEPEFLDLIMDDATVLEREPLEKAAQLGELMAYTHDGFWQCMDTKRDRDSLEKMWQSGNPQWDIKDSE